MWVSVCVGSRGFVSLLQESLGTDSYSQQSKGSCELLPSLNGGGVGVVILEFVCSEEEWMNEGDSFFQSDELKSPFLLIALGFLMEIRFCCSTTFEQPRNHF